ncbi:hypothetical protein HBI11_179720 [Parastagonospora nodorum]|nr:hypothetical protein HBI11_179720 [Parastagonospora nodorum]
MMCRRISRIEPSNGATQDGPSDVQYSPVLQTFRGMPAIIARERNVFVTQRVATFSSTGRAMISVYNKMCNRLDKDVHQPWIASTVTYFSLDFRR